MEMRVGRDRGEQGQSQTEGGQTKQEQIGRRVDGGKQGWVASNSIKEDGYFCLCCIIVQGH